MTTELTELLSERYQRWRTEEADLPLTEVIDRIDILIHNLTRFWSNSAGWAPADAAQLLSQSRLDRIASLAACLRYWNGAEELADGELILAWTTLGGVMEGVLKLFFCVYLVDYRADEATKQTRAFHVKKQILQDPDGLTLDILLSYANLADILPPEELVLARLVQSRRNAIHAFRDREIGTTAELHQAVRDFRLMLRSLHLRLPYPDRYQMPTERQRVE